MCSSSSSLVVTGCSPLLGCLNLPLLSICPTTPLSTPQLYRSACKATCREAMCSSPHNTQRPQGQQRINPSGKGRLLLQLLSHPILLLPFPTCSVMLSPFQLSPFQQQKEQSMGQVVNRRMLHPKTCKVQFCPTCPPYNVMPNPQLHRRHVQLQANPIPQLLHTSRSLPSLVCSVLLSL